MSRYLLKSTLLLALAVVLCCGVFPSALWVVGQVFFPAEANGSLVFGADGKPVGSLLIAQPFTKDEYFQPRPSAASYDASASASSSLAASNYALRDRVARTLGPIVTYAGGQKAGPSVAPDVEAWFQEDAYQGRPHIVAQWASLHPSLAQAWVKADAAHAAYVDGWAKTHAADVAAFIKDNPGTPKPKPDDLAVVFFQSFSNENPGRFPAAVTVAHPDGTAGTGIGPAKNGADIQSTFFDMWRQDHPDASLQVVPGDMVTTSASGLDPHISLENARFQLDRVAARWAEDLHRNPAVVRGEIERLLADRSAAPFGGLIGERYVNVLEVNLALVSRYGVPR